MQLINYIKKFCKLIGLVRLYDMLTAPKRYSQIFKVMDDIKPRNIMEIGTWNGKRAYQMIKHAKKYYPVNKITYYGFDIFENMTKDMYEKEISKMPPSLKDVELFLQKTKANIRLFKGDTIEILPKLVNCLPKMDFIFIDGGHSIKTIINDWNYAKELMHIKTVVIFDDYWNRNDAGAKPIIDKIDRIKYNVEILPVTDKFKKDYGVLKIRLVKVTKR